MAKKTDSLTCEDSIVAFLEQQYGGKSAFLKKGIGDDGAVLKQRGACEHWVVTTDMLLEDIDFRIDWLGPSQLGHKALAVNLSDLAAMGSRPRFYTVALAIPESKSVDWIDRFYRGLTRLGKQEAASLVGGDLSRSPQGVNITITAMGETVHRSPVYRSGGRAGDHLFVTGVLGKASAGLRLLRKHRISGSSKAEREALKAHRIPQPRCRVGLWLASRGLVRCMIDLSDGLSSDLARLCRASNVGAEIYEEALPIFPQSRKWGCDPVELALHGGEDFELLFSVSPSAVARLERFYPRDFPRLSRIGRFSRGSGLVLTGPSGTEISIEPGGFDHFQSSSTS